MLNRHLNPNLANPPPSAIKDLRPMSPMIKSLMVLVGVPSEVVEKFSKDASQDWNRKHWAFCVGVADPTGCLPAGSIFVTGVGVGYDTANNKHQMFITRCPCTEPSDVKVLPVVSHKPASMPVEDWKHLCSISFGLLIFATPNGAAGCSLPESIADGDLDGDPYFLCWDQEILHHISPERLMNTNDDVEDAQDDLIGQDVTTIKDGKLLHGITIRQDDQGGYLCDFLAHGRWSLTKSEVLGDRDFIVKIHDHRGLGVKAEILIEWQFASTPTWERIHGFRNDEANAQVVAEYARVQDLLGTRGWEWTKDFIRPSELAEILEHDERDGDLQVRVIWDHGEVDWESVLELRENEVQENREKLARYAQEKDLLRCEGWTWAESYLQGLSQKWLDPVQCYLVDTDRLVERSRLTEALHNAYCKSINHGSSEQDIKALGRAFKQSIDISKHGGMVDLPFYLRKQVRGTKLQKFLRLV
ncbi:RNA-dependent RNA polymerase [Fragilaria crotonensis]|nr:RNA-dependent RNA polymerase [Fragilaria crotonensis]